MHRNRSARFCHLWQSLRNAVVIWGVVSTLLFAVISITYYMLLPAQQLSLRIKADQPARAQLYIDSGFGFNEAESVLFPLLRTDDYVALTLPLPSGQIRELRLDPSRESGKFRVKGISIIRSDQIIDIPLTTQTVTPIRDISSLQFGATALTIETTTDANDASLRIAPFGRSSVKEWIPRKTRPLVIGLAAAFLGLILLGVIRYSGAEPILLEMTATTVARVFAFLRREISRRPRLAIFLTATIFAVLSSYPVVFLGRTFVSANNGHAPLLYEVPPYIPGSTDLIVEDTRGSDIGAMMWAFRPYSKFQHDAIFQDHELPLWNRYNSFGLTLAGQGVSMIGDPLHWITIAADGAAWAWDAKFVIAKALFAVAIGLTVFMLTESVAAGMLLALSVPFIGFYSFRFNHPAFFSMSYAAWIVLFWLAAGITCSKNIRILYILGVALSVTMTLNSGTVKEAGVLVLTLNLTGFCLFLSMLKSTRARLIWMGITLVLALLVVCVNAPWLLMFYSALKFSFTFSELPYASILPIRALTLLFDNNFHTYITKYEIPFPTINSFILGMLLWFFLEADRTINNKKSTIILASTAIPFIFMFGIIPLSIIVRIPLIRNIGHIADVFGMSVLIHAVLLSGIGCAVLVNRITSWHRLGWRYYAYLSLLVALLIQIWIVHVPSDHRYDDAMRLAGYFGILNLLLVGILPVLLLRIAIQRQRRWLWGPLIVVSIVLLHWRYGMHIESNDKHLDYNLINPRHRVDFFAQSAAVVRVRQNSQQPFRAVGIGNNLFPGYAGAVGIEGFNGPDALINPYYNELVNAFDVHRHPTLDWMPYVGEDDPARIARALDLFNVRYIFSYRSIEPPPDAHLAVRHDLMVYERHTVWPRAFFVKSADIYDDVEGFVSIVMKGSGPLAAIQRSPEGNPLPPARTANDKLPAIPATNYRLTANTTAFTIDAPHPGIVVLTEAYVPEDFELTVNGQAAEYFRVNHAFRGIYLDSPGKYDISYTYWPRYLTAALWLSAFAAILLLVAAIAPFVVPLCYRKLFGTN